MSFVFQRLYSPGLLAVKAAPFLHAPLNNISLKHLRAAPVKRFCGGKHQPWREVALGAQSLACCPESDFNSMTNHIPSHWFINRRQLRWGEYPVTVLFLSGRRVTRGSWQKRKMPHVCMRVIVVIWIPLFQDIFQLIGDTQVKFMPTVTWARGGKEWKWRLEKCQSYAKSPPEKSKSSEVIEVNKPYDYGCKRENLKSGWNWPKGRKFMTALLKQKGDHKMVLGRREHCILATHPKMRFCIVISFCGVGK